MIRRIELRNFMSHSHTVLELADGLTVLIGDNNSGKSAVVAALQTVCENATGSYMVRHGERECEVTVETDEADGQRHVVTWRKIKGKVGYVVNGREVDRLKGGVPDDLHQLLRLPRVQTSRDSFNVHVGEQKHPIFLLADKASDRAAFFASSSDTCKLIAMQELHRTQTKEARRDRKRKLEERSQLHHRLDRFVELDHIESRLELLEQQFDEIQRAEHLSNAIQSAVGELNRSSNLLKQFSGTNGILEQLAKPPELLPTSRIQSIVDELKVTSHQIQLQELRLQSLKLLHRPPKLRSGIELERIIHSIESEQQRGRRYSREIACLEKLVEPPDRKLYEDSSKLARLVSKLQVVQDEIDSARSTVKTLNAQLETTERDLREKFQEFESCPTCGQQIDVEYSLTRTTALSVGSRATSRLQTTTGKKIVVREVDPSNKVGDD